MGSRNLSFNIFDISVDYMLYRLGVSLPAGGALPLDLAAGGRPLGPERVHEIAADAPHAAFVGRLVARLQKLWGFGILVQSSLISPYLNYINTW